MVVAKLLLVLAALVGCTHALSVVHGRSVCNFATHRRCAATQQRRCLLLRMDEANDAEANDADDDNLSPIQRMRKQYEEKPEESGGWSIFAAGSPWAGEDSTPKPDPPWLAAAKKRSDERAASSAGKAWNESPYASESKPQSGIDMAGMKAQYQKPRWADIFGMGGGKEEAAPADDAPPAAENSASDDTE